MPGKRLTRQAVPSTFKGGKKPVQKIPSTSVAARDEGPRLLPLDGNRAVRRDPVTGPYVALADHALRIWAKNEKK